MENTANKLKLKVNVEKSKICIFSRGRHLVDVHFSLNGSKIEIVNELYYLGILLNRTSNFNKAVTEQTEMAKQAIHEV